MRRGVAVAVRRRFFAGLRRGQSDGRGGRVGLGARLGGDLSLRGRFRVCLLAVAEGLHRGPNGRNGMAFFLGVSLGRIASGHGVPEKPWHASCDSAGILYLEIDKIRGGG